ncbi:MAG: phosphatidate cytidylyltransferase [Candidatus Omnitrophota bacterium]
MIIKKENGASAHRDKKIRMIMFLQRLVSGIGVLIVTGAVLLLFPAWAFALLVIAFIILGLNELFLLIQQKEIGVNRKLGITLGVLLAVATYYDYKIPYEWSFMLIPLICLIIFAVQFTKRDNRAVVSISTIFFGLVYVSWFLSFFIRLRSMPDLPSELMRKQLIVFLILVTKSGDIGAYFLGTRFGKHSLIPRISPKKTVEGMVGGLVMSVLVAVASHTFLPNFSYLRLAILGIVLGALAQVGDLSESLIKRDCQVKDSGGTLPGLGGVLDTVDSLLFTAPIFYFYLKVFML